MPTLPPPRVLLSVDYEPWFALSRRYDGLSDSTERRELDGGFTQHAIDGLLEQMGTAKVSFYLVGEIADWYPEVPRKIVAAGHELGLHCHIHRPLVKLDELAADIKMASTWSRQYGVRGYRAPMVGIHEGAYPILEQAGFLYSSSIYAPAGILISKGKMWEVPVSTLAWLPGARTYPSPRDFSLRLLLGGEIPYGSSFTIGLLGHWILKTIERELQMGRSPVLILHPYELIAPEKWPWRLGGDLIRHPKLWPFTWDKSRFLAELLRRFPTSSLLSYVEEHAVLYASGNAR